MLCIDALWLFELVDYNSKLLATGNGNQSPLRPQKNLKSNDDLHTQSSHSILSLSKCWVFLLNETTKCRSSGKSIFEVSSSSNLISLRASSPCDAKRWMHRIRTRHRMRPDRTDIELCEDAIARQSQQRSKSNWKHTKISIRDILRTTMYRYALYDYSESEKVKKIVNFWIQAEVYRRMLSVIFSQWGLAEDSPEKNMLGDAKPESDVFYVHTLSILQATTIFHRFCRDGSSVSSICSKHDRMEVLRHLCHLRTSPSLFSRLQVQVEEHLERIVYPKFVVSSNFLRIFECEKDSIEWWRQCLESSRCGFPRSFCGTAKQKRRSQMTVKAMLARSTSHYLSTPVHHISLDRGVMNAVGKAYFYGWLHVANKVGFDLPPIGICCRRFFEERHNVNNEQPRMNGQKKWEETLNGQQKTSSASDISGIQNGRDSSLTDSEGKSDSDNERILSEITSAMQLDLQRQSHHQLGSPARFRSFTAGIEQNYDPHRIMKNLDRWEELWLSNSEYFLRDNSRDSKTERCVTDTVVSIGKALQEMIERTSSSENLENLLPVVTAVVAGSDRLTIAQDISACTFLVEEELRELNAQKEAVYSMQKVLRDASERPWIKKSVSSLTSYSAFSLHPTVPYIPSAYRIRYFGKKGENVRYMVSTRGISSGMKPERKENVPIHSRPVCANNSLACEEVEILQQGWVTLQWIETSHMWTLAEPANSSVDNALDDHLCEKAVNWYGGEFYPSVPICPQGNEIGSILDKITSREDLQQLLALDLLYKQTSLRCLSIGARRVHTTTHINTSLARSVPFSVTSPEETSDEHGVHSSPAATSVSVSAYAVLLKDGRLLFSSGDTLLEKPRKRSNSLNGIHIAPRSSFLGPIRSKSTISNERGAPSQVYTHHMSNSWWTPKGRTLSLGKSENSLHGVEEDVDDVEFSSDTDSECESDRAFWRKWNRSSISIHETVQNFWGGVGVGSAIYISESKTLTFPSDSLCLGFPLGELHITPYLNNEEWTSKVQRVSKRCEAHTPRASDASQHFSRTSLSLNRNKLYGNPIGICMENMEFKTKSSIFKVMPIESESGIPPDKPPATDIESIANFLERDRLVLNYNAPAPADSTIRFQGWIWKRGRINTGFKLRWCVLTSSGNLSYYDLQLSDGRFHCRNTLCLKDRIKYVRVVPFEFSSTDDVDTSNVEESDSYTRANQDISRELAVRLSNASLMEQPRKKTLLSRVAGSFMSRSGRVSFLQTDVGSDRKISETPQRSLDISLAVGIHGDSAHLPTLEAVDLHRLRRIVGHNIEDRETIMQFTDKLDAALSRLYLVSPQTMQMIRNQCRTGGQGTSCEERTKPLSMLEKGKIPVSIELLTVNGSYKSRLWRFIAPSALEGARWVSELRQFLRPRDASQEEIFHFQKDYGQNEAS